VIIDLQGSLATAEDGCKKGRGYNGAKCEESSRYQYDFRPRQHC